MDSILIDEARTPLIISGKGEDSSSLYTQVDRFVRTLHKSVVVELEDKVEADEQTDGDYVVDEKHKTCTLTAKGIQKAEEYFKVENLAAAENMTLAHHIDQAIKAYGVMQKDIDYVVKNGEVIIVDEFTGRLMIGRRYNENNTNFLLLNFYNFLYYLETLFFTNSRTSSAVDNDTASSASFSISALLKEFTILRAFKICVADIENSSNPKPNKIGTAFSSPAIAPHIPAHLPSL